EEPEPIAPLVSGDDDVEDDFDIDMDPEDIPEPDPIPNVFTPTDDDEDEPKPRSLVKIILISVISLIVVLLLTFVFAKGPIMNMLPFTTGIYKAIGLGEKLGAGLKIGSAKPTRGTSRGKEALIVSGVITNVTDETRHVPMIKVTLHDGENNVVQSAVAPPLKSELAAGQQMKFKVTLVEPSPLARRIEVIFSAPEEPGEKKAP
ncbi:MAG: DUF3426 domain-containing protein, partial [Rhodospirillaceae bacterium]|nr:DUF3426 domain-containing protein [Rhodospirillaceae bacterium]